MRQLSLTSLATFATLAIVGGAIAISSPTLSRSQDIKQQTKQQTSNLISYNNSAQKLRIQYPRTWTKKEQSAGALVVFLSPKENSSDKFQESLGLVVRNLPVQILSLDQMTELTLQHLKRSITDFNLVSSNSINLANGPARQIVYTGKREGVNVKCMLVSTLKDNRMYVIVYTAETGKYPNFLSTVQQMLNSFRIS